MGEAGAVGTMAEKVNRKVDAQYQSLGEAQQRNEMYHNEKLKAQREKMMNDLIRHAKITETMKVNKTIAYANLLKKSNKKLTNEEAFKQAGETVEMYVRKSEKFPGRVESAKKMYDKMVDLYDIDSDVNKHKFADEAERKVAADMFENIKTSR